MSDASQPAKTADITAQDESIIEAFFAGHPGLVPGDFDVRLSKAGNLMAVRRGSSNADGQVVFDRSNGSIIAIGPEVENPGACEKARQARAARNKEKNKPGAACFEQEDLELAQKLADGLVAKHRYVADKAVAKLEPNGRGIFVEFGNDPDGAFIMPPVSIKWTKRCKKRDFRRSYIEFAFASISPVPSAQTVRKVKEAVQAVAAEHARKYGSADVLAEPFAKALPSKVTQAIHSLIDLPDKKVDRLSVRFSDGKFSVSYGNISLECSEGLEKPKLTRTGREHLKRFDEAWRCRKSLGEAVAYAEDLQVPGQLSFDYDGDTLKISAVGHRSRSQMELAVPGSYKRAIGKFAKAFSEKERQAGEAAISAIAAREEAGSLLSLAAATVVAKNSDYITENAAVKVLRGLKLSEHYQLTATPYDGKFNIIPDEDVHQAIRGLVRGGLLKEKYVDGKYTGYYLLKPTDDMEDFMTAASSPNVQVKALGKQEALEREAVRLASYAKEPVAGKLDEDLDYLIEHPALLCCATAEVSAWLAKLPEEYKNYLTLRVRLEDEAKTKKYLKLLSDAASGKAVSTEKGKRSAPKPSQKEPDFIAVKSDEFSSRWDIRFVVVDTRTGDVVDTAQGYGYKSEKKAMAAWRYKQRRNG